MTTTPTHTDRESLRGHAYATTTPLQTRRALYEYRRPRLDLVGEVVHRLGNVPTGVVADVGCGTGVYSRALREARPDLTVVATDLSPGMVSAAGGTGAVIDAMELPFADRSCTAVLGLHMLYHVPDPGRAVAEFARVVRADGSVIIMGNGEGDKRELDVAWARAVKDVTGRTTRGLLGGVLSAEAMGELAREHFPVVESVHYRARTVAPAEPVVAFFGSIRHLSELGESFDAVLARATELVEEEVAEQGAFTISNHVGMYRAQVEA